jgi:hypothetical protein
MAFARRFQDRSKRLTDRKRRIVYTCRTADQAAYLLALALFSPLLVVFWLFQQFFTILRFLPADQGLLTKLIDEFGHLLYSRIEIDGDALLVAGPHEAVPLIKVTRRYSCLRTRYAIDERGDLALFHDDQTIPLPVCLAANVALRKTVAAHCARADTLSPPS